MPRPNSAGHGTNDTQGSTPPPGLRTPSADLPQMSFDFAPRQNAAHSACSRGRESLFADPQTTAVPKSPQGTDGKFKVKDDYEAAQLKRRIRVCEDSHRSRRLELDAADAALEQAVRRAEQEAAGAVAPGDLASCARAIVGVGCPAVDIGGEVDDEFLARHNLTPGEALSTTQGGAIDDRVAAIAAELGELRRTRQHAGGPCLNAIRVAQRLLLGSGGRGAAPAVCFIGAASDDELGQRLRELLRKDGVEALLTTAGGRRTGVHCAARLRRKGAWLDNSVPPTYACSAAAGCTLDGSLLSREGPPRDALRGARVVLLDAALCHLCPAAAEAAAAEAAAGHATVALWLHSGAPVALGAAAVQRVLPFVTLLFCSHSALAALGRVYGCDPPAEAAWAVGAAGERREEDDDRRALALIQGLPVSPAAHPAPVEGRWGQPEPTPASLRRVVVIRGTRPVLVADAAGIAEYAPDLLDSGEIADRVAAGDAFVGGFLGRLCMDGGLASCIDWAHAAARAVLTTDRCVLPVRQSTRPPISEVDRKVRQLLSQ
eukprot:TRINITY_DN25224_c0_g1_i1.p1 TRINITY_DN25224_c0_g1~~TRINITY_DN25224_c0_g1_i1.p1  ORF type:complete len:573 (+),score=152.10 TRINITY_DN25224_c0_g1_i1:86-1720(+)